MGKIITAIILAGGKGERLRPITNNIPKPMVCINNKPVLEYIINQFKKNNIRDIIISVCYLSDTITNYFGDGEKFGVNISYIYEDPETPLGTAGSIAKLFKKLKKTFIVCYGDTLRNIEIKKLLEQHLQRMPIATVCVYKNTKPNPKSTITFDEKNTVLSYVERPGEIKSQPIWSNAGFYVLEPKIFRFIPQHKKSDFGKDIFPSLIKRHKKMESYIIDGYFLDIGTVEKISTAEYDIQIGKLEC